MHVWQGIKVRTEGKCYTLAVTSVVPGSYISLHCSMSLTLVTCMQRNTSEVQWELAMILLSDGSQTMFQDLVKVWF